MVAMGMLDLDINMGIPPEDAANLWGGREQLELYLDRCQVDTPHILVDELWRLVRERRAEIVSVVDYGAGDCRFAMSDAYQSYIGYELDEHRSQGARLPSNAIVKHSCAFGSVSVGYDLSIGNPPYVRNQDLPLGWRQKAARILKKRTGVSVSGLANAWQYFFLLSLATVNDSGLVALVIPFEWVSRPSSEALRDYIINHGWKVSVYKLRDNTFDNVLTTASLTIVDKSVCSGEWEYFEQIDNGLYAKMTSPVKSGEFIEYAKKTGERSLYAKRGLSPGTQKVLTLTEGERARLGLIKKRDVMPCITTLRHVDSNIEELDELVFDKLFVKSGRKCWLINTDGVLSKVLTDYLDSIAPEEYQTSTCLNREKWWKFTMPVQPLLLLSTGFVGAAPKVMINKVGARAVGGVCGIYSDKNISAKSVLSHIKMMNLANVLVAHSNGLIKLEINQLNTILDGFIGVQKDE